MPYLRCRCERRCLKDQTTPGHVYMNESDFTVPALDCKDRELIVLYGRTSADEESGFNMATRRFVLKAGISIAAATISGACYVLPNSTSASSFTHTEAEWRKILTADQFSVLRQSATERPFTSKLLHEARSGTFNCAGCDLQLFQSSVKFDSGTGWPSFWKAIDNSVITKTDGSLGMDRTSVSCRRCEGHLGHVFNDGPKPTGLRYCMNGVALKFSVKQA